jgi:DNA polymerase sigma
MAADTVTGAPRGGQVPAAPRGRRGRGRGRGTAAAGNNGDANESVTDKQLPKLMAQTSLNTATQSGSSTQDPSGASNNHIAHTTDVPKTQTSDRKPHVRNNRRGRRGGGSRKQSDQSSSQVQTETSVQDGNSNVDAEPLVNGGTSDIVKLAANLPTPHKLSLQQIQTEQESDRKPAPSNTSPPTGPRALLQHNSNTPRRRHLYQKFPVETHHTDSHVPAQGTTQTAKVVIPADSFSRPSPNTISRPSPCIRKVFEQPVGHPGLPHPSRDRAVPIPHAVHFLERMASVHISATQITADELFEKEAWRKELQELCRATIGYYASQTNPNFNPMSVTLKCFGSLRAGYATRASDMDLALESPDTEADPHFDQTTIPRLLEHVLLVKGYGARLLTRTRVPLLKLCEMPSQELRDKLVAERLKWEESQQATDVKHADADVKHQSGAPADTDPGDFANDHEIAIDSADATGIEGANPAETGSVNDEPKGMKGKSDEELIRLFDLAMKEGWYSEEDRLLIANFAHCYQEAHDLNDDPALQEARMLLRKLPNVLSKYRPPVNNQLDFPKSGVGIQCDINFSNPLALHNTSLLRCYNICDPRIHQMILFVKAWAKRRDINSPYKGTLSSYGYVLMVLHYVVNVASPPLAPNLQLELGPVRGGAPETPRECNGYNVQFWRNERQISNAAANGMITYSEESLGSLLRGFFSYFAETGSPALVPMGGFNWTREVLSLRTEGGILTKEEKGWTGARTDTVESNGTGEKPVEVRQRFLFAVEDPFETDHNVGRPVAHNGICAIRDEFRRANRIIRCGGVLGGESHDLFAEHKHTELDREVRYFGPNPANATKPKHPGPKPARNGAKNGHGEAKAGPLGPATAKGTRQQ